MREMKPGRAGSKSHVDRIAGVDHGECNKNAGHQRLGRLETVEFLTESW